MQNTKYCKFYFVRHGETEWNIKKLIQGHHDSPLSENGVKQAEEAAKKLKDIKFSYAFSSDLGRAYRTASIIAADRDLAIKTNKLLRESAFGPFEGKSIDYFRETLKKAITYRDGLYGEQSLEYKIHPEVESDGETATRMLTFLREVAVAYPGETVLAVSHARSILSMLAKLGFGDVDSNTIGNTAYAVIESDGVDFFVRETAGIDKK